ncbi:MAG: hypothetical protein IV107_12995 [Paucibacter sp.]|nr:hypothetical protein [Roseateles sp.]
MYEIFDIEYLLPWGKINNWAEVSSEAFWHYSVLFSLHFFLLCALIKNRSFERASVQLAYWQKNVYCRWKNLSLLLLVVFSGAVLFLQLSGGFAAWFSDYSNTYLNNKAGLGVLNIFLIWMAHFIAFIFGYLKYVLKKKVGFTLAFCGFSILFMCMFLQGFKSRLPLILFFFFAPKLLTTELKITRGIVIFLLLIAMFLIGMFFRSEGFYNTPRLGVEYLLSYFNTIFLHDTVLKEYSSGQIQSMFMPFNKMLEIFGTIVPREKYDLSVFLTQQYFPNDWFQDGATQQWPLETDLYLTMPFTALWVIPALMYCGAFFLIFRLINKGTGFFLFVYAAEIVRIISVFRSGYLTWDIWVNIILYFLMYFFWKMLFYMQRVPKTTETAD